jgi:hypothetical protein
MSNPIKEIPTLVQVTFMIPGHGPIKEVYSMTNPHDIACWRGNNKLTNAVQLSVKTIETAPWSFAIGRKMVIARKKAKKIYETMVKGF